MAIKVEMLIHQFRPIACGAELQAERLAAKLVERDCSVEVMTRWLDKSTPLQENYHGFDILRVPYHLGYKIDYTCVQTLRHLYRKRHEFDIIHSHMVFGHALVGTMLAQLCGKKSLFKIACAGQFGDLALLSSFRFGKAAIEILKTTDAIVAISREVKNELITYGFPEQRIHWIPNGVDTGDFQRKTPYDYPSDNAPFRFILTGRQCPQKGIDTTIAAVKMLKERNSLPHFVVELYGNDYPEYDYRTMAKDAGVSDQVIFYPYSTEVKKMLNEVHCFILPSRGEGLSNALLEAMSMELPVIVSKVSGTEDVVTDRQDGLLIAPDSPEQLAGAMALILRDKGLADQLRRNARMRVCTAFSLDVVADRYRLLYEDLLKK